MNLSLYEGDVVVSPASTHTHKLREAIFGACERNGLHVVQSWSKLLAQYDLDWLNERLEKVKAALQQDELVVQLTVAMLRSLDACPRACVFDTPRLRCISAGLESMPRCESVFHAHRDTWFANPQCQVNVWLPLLDVQQEEIFVIYPDYFRTAVPNNSSLFQYSAWAESGGFQAPSSRTVPPSAVSRVYCRATESRFDVRHPLESLGTRVWRPQRMSAGEALLFAAHHLHQTRPMPADTVRWSVDVRVVHAGLDAAGKGAPSVDNESQGDAVLDYRRMCDLRRVRDAGMPECTQPQCEYCSKITGLAGIKQPYKYLYIR